MKFSYKWLQNYIDLNISHQKLADELTFSGIEVEAVNQEQYFQYIENVKVAEIISTQIHPNSNNLFICKVSDGSSIKQVVCGASNCDEGLKTAFIPADSTLGDSIIKNAMIKGIKSEGMLCSEQDLHISDNHDGIISLPLSAKNGTPLQDVYESKNVLYEVEITPNRPDLLGILGIARDIAAILNLSLQYPQIPTYKGIDHDPNLVDNQDYHLCPRYLAKVIKGVNVQESPFWLREKLRSVNIKPVNNIVDITNYIMLEFGHPLHAFDYDLIKDGKIVVRKAKSGETFTALNNKNYDLQDTDLVIADSTKPVAIAGIIGNIGSSITKHTKNIVLEAANFNYVSIRQTTNRLKINTDSAYRFQRNLSSHTVSDISDRATELILDICGGKLVSYCDSYPSPIVQKTVKIRPSRVNKILTTDLSADQIINYLEKLEFQLVNVGLFTSDSDNNNNNSIQEIKSGNLNISDSKVNYIEFSITHFRKDVSREIDIIEEIIRLYGYNRIKTTGSSSRIILTDKNRLTSKRMIADFLSYCGFLEVINSSFADKKQLNFLELADNDYRHSYIELDNPIGSDSSILRSSLLPGILQNLRLNINNKQDNLKLFELGRVYYDQDNMAIEKLHLSGIVAGDHRKYHWKYKTIKADIFTVKGTIEKLLEKVNDKITSKPDDSQPFLQKGQGLSLLYGKKILGFMGKLDPLIAKQFEIEQPIYIFDIDLEEILLISAVKEKHYKDIIRYPDVERDISFIVDRNIDHADIVRKIKETNHQLIQDVLLIDEFIGKNIQVNHRSLTYRLVLSSNKGTLTDDTIQKLVDKVFNQLSVNYEIKKR